MQKKKMPWPLNPKKFLLIIETVATSNVFGHCSTSVEAITLADMFVLVCSVRCQPPSLIEKGGK